MRFNPLFFSSLNPFATKDANPPPSRIALIPPVNPSATAVPPANLNAIWSRGPARGGDDWYTAGYPIGNGFLGEMVGGAPGEDSHWVRSFYGRGGVGFRGLNSRCGVSLCEHVGKHRDALDGRVSTSFPFLGAECGGLTFASQAVPERFVLGWGEQELAGITPGKLKILLFRILRLPLRLVRRSLPRVATSFDSAGVSQRTPRSWRQQEHIFPRLAPEVPLPLLYSTKYVTCVLTILLLLEDMGELMGDSSDRDYGSFTTAGRLSILSPSTHEEKITEYTRTLDFDLGVVRVSWVERGEQFNRSVPRSCLSRLTTLTPRKYTTGPRFAPSHPKYVLPIRRRPDLSRSSISCRPPTPTSRTRPASGPVPFGNEGGSRTTLMACCRFFMKWSQS